MSVAAAGTLTTFVVEVTRREPASDPGGARFLRAAKAAGLHLVAARLADVYEVTGDELDAGAAERLGQALFPDVVLDQARVLPAGATPACAPGELVVTALRRPGVMDPVALTISLAARDLGVSLSRARTARRIYVQPAKNQDPAEVTSWLARRLGNPVVDQVLVGPSPLPAPGAASRPDASRPTGALRRDVPLAGLSPDALLALSKARTLALDAVEMQAVQAHYAKAGRAPTDVELETIAQTWSEHCKHKTLAGPVVYEERAPDGTVVRRDRWDNLLKETIFAATKKLNAPRCVSVFEDNAGVVRFDERLGVAVKVETHNHPSAIEPYGGAGTGVGGVIRDIMGTGLGADPLLNLDVFCVGDLDMTPDQVPPGASHPAQILEGIVSGVRDYGNRMGIPTVCGALVSEPRYVGNPLVFCGTVGLMPLDRVAKAAKPGDWVVVAGGRTGRDGVHGATFSSEELSHSSEVESGGAVQIGNPITQKMLMDVLLDIRDRGWLHAVTDCGAGGLSSAVGEMAADTGARIDLALSPLKYPGLSPWEVWVSEAQERMVLAVSPERGPDVLAAFAAEDVEAVRLGAFSDDHQLVLTWKDEVVGALDLEFLHHGLPKQPRQAVWTRRVTRPADLPATLVSGKAGEHLRALLSEPTACSKEWIVRQYDHEVQGGAAIKAFTGLRARGPSDGVAVAPLLGGRFGLGRGGSSARGIVVGLGINPRHGAGDPYLMALSVIDEALRNCVATGADLEQCAILDNFSWGDCRKPDTLGELARAAKGCHDAAMAYEVPFISGKDSLNNEFRLPDGSRVAIPGTLLITAVAVVPDVQRLVTSDLKGADHDVLLIGETRPELLGALALDGLSRLAGRPLGGLPPTVQLEQAPGVHRAVARAIATGGVLACHDLSEGGLAAAAAETAFAGGVGLELDLTRVPQEGLRDVAGPARDWTLLFSETPTRFLLEVDPAQKARVEAALDGVPFAAVGRTTTTPRLVARGVDGTKCLDESLDGLETAWRAPLFQRFDRTPPPA